MINNLPLYERTHPDGHLNVVGHLLWLPIFRNKIKMPVVITLQIHDSLRITCFRFNKILVNYYIRMISGQWFQRIRSLKNWLKIYKITNYSIIIHRLDVVEAWFTWQLIHSPVVAQYTTSRHSECNLSWVYIICLSACMYESDVEWNNENRLLKLKCTPSISF